MPETTYFDRFAPDPPGVYTPEALRQLVRDERIRRDLTQEEAGALCDPPLPQQVVSNAECGRPSHDWATARLAEALLGGRFERIESVHYRHVTT